MKIYKYYGGVVHELEVRETKKMYIAEGATGLAFNGRSRWDKPMPITPLEAIQEKINAHLSVLEGLKDRIHRIDSDLGTLRKLEKAYSELPYL